MKQLNSEELRQMLLCCAGRIEANEEHLSAVDAAIGDGDHGIGMANGMKALRKYVDSHPEVQDVNALFKGAAEAMQNAMGGASGMIFSAMFEGDAADKTPAENYSAENLLSHLSAGLEKIRKIGHAAPGDKTMVDALAPAVEAMKEHANSLEEMLDAGAKAAREGAEKTKNYVARFGRAKNLGTRALGHEDAGAVSTWLLLSAMADFVNNREEPALLPAHSTNSGSANASAQGNSGATNAPTQGNSAETISKQDNSEATASKQDGNAVAPIPWKKKIINDPSDVVAEEGEGFLAAFGGSIAAVEGVNGFVRRNIPDGKTILLVGGGSGHEPMFGFFIGENLADCAANGNVFASPSPEIIVKTALAADKGAGILFVYGNYAGDNLNFDRAAELLEDRGIPVRTVRVRDDVASAPKERTEDRRGIAGDVLMLKIAGAACGALPLEEAYRVAAKARDNLFSVGVALDGATIPGRKEPIFTLAPDEMEFGLGIHGEPGVERVKAVPADAIVDRLFDTIVADAGLKAGDTVCTYVNGLGSTTLMELMIMNRRLAQRCREAGLIVHDMDVNSLVISMEMAGASISIMKMDEELLKYYDMPCRSPYYNKF